MTKFAFPETRTQVSADEWQQRVERACDAQVKALASGVEVIGCAGEIGCDGALQESHTLPIKPDA